MCAQERYLLILLLDCILKMRLMIMRAILLRKAKDSELLDKKSIEEILLELAKLRAVKVGGKWRLTEISKKQRTILEKMKIGIPVEANLVIKRAGV